MNRSFTTEKGTVLPLLNLRGKDYLEVKYRLVWFREEHPSWTIETDFISITDRSASAKAIVRDETGRIIATSHKTENSAGFPDFMEKAETGAIGRALALIGYGTQFCADELDEGSRIVDSPADPVRTSAGLRTSIQPQATSARSSSLSGDSETALDELRSTANLGEYVVPFGRKYRGKKLKEIPQAELESYVDWLKAESEKKGQIPSFEVRALEKAVQWYFHPETRPQPTEGKDRKKSKSAAESKEKKAAS